MNLNRVQSLVNNIFEKFSSDPGKMLIYTGVFGWFLSSAAQVVAIAVNKNIPKEQKSYLIPQEIADGAVNVFSFFLITQSIKSLTSKLVSTGKIISPKVKNFLLDKGVDLKNSVGKPDFNISKLLTGDLEAIKPDYNKFKGGLDVIATTAGSILSCNIVTPIIRNNIAANRQRQALDTNKNQLDNYQRPKGLTMEQFINNAAIKYGSGNLKI